MSNPNANPNVRPQRPSSSAQNPQTVQRTPHKKLKKGYFHRDMTSVNVLVAVLAILANLAVIYLLLNTTQFSNLSKMSFLLVNILCMVLLLVMNWLIMVGIRGRKKSVYISAIVLLCLFLVIGGYGGWAIFNVNNSISKITNTSSTKENVSTSLVVYSDSGTQAITDVTQLEGKMVGYATGTNTATLGQNKISSENVNVTYKEYQDYSSLMIGLFNNEVQCAILPSSYESMFQNESGLADYLTNTAAILTFEESVTSSASTTGSDKDLTKDPFTVLLIGNADGLSDTIILCSINPISMKITMSSIARDSYVPITCYNNGSSKINAAHSVSRDCLISTVQQLTGVSIDYYIDTNFQGVVDVVNALGGIVVNSPLEFVGQTASSVRGTKTVWVPAGDNVLLNGDQALAFARERYAFQTGDFARQEHQQQVIKAIIRTIMRTRDINTFLKVVQAFGDNVTTNFTVGQMTDFVSYCMQKVNRYYDSDHVENIFNIVNSRVTGYSSGLWDDGLGIVLYIYRLYQGSLTDTKAAVDRNINMNSVITADKQLMWNANWDYDPPAISADEYNEAKVQSEVPSTVGNYVGQSISKLQAWASAFGIAVNIGYEYNETQAEGIILWQDVAAGTAAGDISAINVTVATRNGDTAAAGGTTTTGGGTTDSGGSTTSGGAVTSCDEGKYLVNGTCMDTPSCGANAYYDGYQACHCNDGYTGDPVAGCVAQ